MSLRVDPLPRPLGIGDGKGPPRALQLRPGIPFESPLRTSFRKLLDSVDSFVPVAEL